MKKPFTPSLLIGVNAAIAMLSAAPAHAIATPPSDEAAEAPTAFARANKLSVASMEASFLKVPGLCKARNAAFDPVRVTNEDVSSAALAVHAALHAAGSAA